MESDRAISRAVRLTQIQHFLHTNANGLTSRDLSKLCGVCIRTIQRDLLALQTELQVPLTQEDDRYGILEGYVLPPVSLSLYEAVVLFLAARLVMRQTDKQNPHMESALSRLSSILPLPISRHMEQGLRNLDKKSPNPDYLQVFEQVAIAWSTQRLLQFNYRSLQSTEIKQWVIAPYFIEMTGTAYSLYVIGRVFSGEREGIITFKLDRMRQVQLLEEGFEMPDDLRLDDLLESSWGVIWGEEVQVKLQFSPKVTRRVKESVWHPSQLIEDLPDGGCIMTVRVGSTLEMTPWIRGWGPDVEVLEPESLRSEFTAWAKQLSEIYR